MATITWKGVNGAWNSPLDWVGFTEPAAADDAVLNAGTVTLDAPASIQDVTLAAASTADFSVQSALTLHGRLLLAGGTLDLSSGGGTIEGGTLDLAGGTLLGGLVDGSLILGGFGHGLTVTAATVTANLPASGTLAVIGALTLAAGTYDGSTLSLDTFTTQQNETLATAGDVTFGAAETLLFSDTDPLVTPGVEPFGGAVGLAASGQAVNRGLIYADTSMTLSGDSFLNAGLIDLVAYTEPGLVYPYTIGTFKGQSGSLYYSATWTETITIAATAFDNTGRIAGYGADLMLTGATFTNEGSIALTDAIEQRPMVTKTSAYVGTFYVAAQLTVAAAVTDFSNTGTIVATTITFDDNLTLAALGSLGGHVVFAGTLDLQSGTLDLATFGTGSSFAFTGTVANGIIVINGATADLSGATLVNVTTLATAPLTDILSGTVTLGAVVTELAYTTAASVDNLSVTAGALGTTDLIGARAAGTLTFGAGTAITDVVAGSTLAIGGLGSFSDAGRITLDGATLVIDTTLDGDGTISLADGAALSIAELAATATTTIVFGAGHNLLSLPADGSGLNGLSITLSGLAIGDLIDFTGVSANPPTGTFSQGGAGIDDQTLDVQGASGDQAQVLVTAAAAGVTFVVSSDPTGGTLVTVACFPHRHPHRRRHRRVPGGGAPHRRHRPHRRRPAAPDQMAGPPPLHRRHRRRPGATAPGAHCRGRARRRPAPPRPVPLAAARHPDRWRAGAGRRPGQRRQHQPRPDRRRLLHPCRTGQSRPHSGRGHRQRNLRRLRQPRDVRQRRRVRPPLPRSTRSALDLPGAARRTGLAARRHPPAPRRRPTSRRPTGRPARQHRPRR